MYRKSVRFRAESDKVINGGKQKYAQQLMWQCNESTTIVGDCELSYNVFLLRCSGFAPSSNLSSWIFYSLPPRYAMWCQVSLPLKSKQYLHLYLHLWHRSCLLLQWNGLASASPETRSSSCSDQWRHLSAATRVVFSTHKVCSITMLGKPPFPSLCYMTRE